MARTASLQLPGTLDAAPLAGEALRALCADAGLSDLDLHRIELALAEALNNIVMHGYRGSDGAIDLRMEWSGDRVTLALHDDGPPFEALPEAAHPADDLPTGGWGLSILYAVMDDVVYRREDGRNVLTLVKRLGPSDA